MSIATDDYTDVSHKEETEDASCYISEDVYRYRFPPAGPDSQERLLRLTVSQANLDSTKPGLRNLTLPLEIILIEEAGEMIFEDRFAYDHWGHFLFHSWRKYDQSKGTYVDANNKPIDDRIHTDANPTKAFELGEVMSTMTRHRIYPKRIEKNPAIQALKNHTLWQLPH